MIKGKTEEKTSKVLSGEKPQFGKFNAHFADSSNVEPKCCFCGKSQEHITTNGPKGTKIIQYFACENFAEMNPKERLQESRSKGYYFQCLFPGALKNKGKHNEGMCQRDFVCKHKSHDKYPIKKHVLVCHEHRNNSENQELLQQYKERCIMRQQVQLPRFSKELKLTLGTNMRQRILKKIYQTRKKPYIFYRRGRQAAVVIVL